MFSDIELSEEMISFQAADQYYNLVEGIDKTVYSREFYGEERFKEIT